MCCLVIDRSAEDSTVVVAVAVLSAATGSAAPLVTLAVAVSVPPPAVTVPLTVMAGAAPVASGALAVQVTVPLVVHVQPVPEAAVTVSPAGTGRVTTVPGALAGPALATLTVYVSGRPASTGSGLSVRLTLRSAVTTVSDSVAAAWANALPSMSV